MSLKANLSKKLSPELLQQVEDALGDDFDFDLVPRSRLNKVIAQRNEAREALAQASQAGGSSSDDDDDDDDEGIGTTGEGSAQSQKNLAKLLKQKERERDDAIRAVKIQYAALDKLRSAGAIDADICFGLLDGAKLALDDKGTLTGLDEQLTDLQKNKSFLFNSEPSGENVQGGTGRQGGYSSGAGVDSAVANVFAGYGILPVEKG